MGILYRRKYPQESNHVANTQITLALSLSLSLSLFKGEVYVCELHRIFACHWLLLFIQGNYSFVNFQPHMPYLILEWIRITLHVDDTCMQ